MARPIKKSTELTRAEMEIMQILWDIEQGTVYEIIDKIQTEPKPAYNTVSTIARILVDKNYLEAVGSGRSHIYKPIVSKENYAKKAMSSVLSNFFDNSLANVVSFFAQNEKLSKKEIEEIKKLLDK